MTHEKDTIWIRGSEWDRTYVEESIAYSRSSAWQETKWRPRPALVHRDGGRVSLYTGQGYDPDKIDLVEDGWNHDHCQICWWDLHEADDAEHGIGYSDGEGWLCSECYNKFIVTAREGEAGRDRTGQEPGHGGAV